MTQYNKERFESGLQKLSTALGDLRNVLATHGTEHSGSGERGRSPIMVNDRMVPFETVQAALEAWDRSSGEPVLCPNCNETLPEAREAAVGDEDVLCAACGETLRVEPQVTFLATVVSRTKETDS